MKLAQTANTSGNAVGAPSTSEMICWEEVMKPTMPPNMKACARM